MKDNMKLKQITWNANKYRNCYQWLSLKLKFILKSEPISVLKMKLRINVIKQNTEKKCFDKNWKT